MAQVEQITNPYHNSLCLSQIAEAVATLGQSEKVKQICNQAFKMSQVPNDIERDLCLSFIAQSFALVDDFSEALRIVSMISDYIEKIEYESIAERAVNHENVYELVDMLQESEAYDKSVWLYSIARASLN